MLLVNTALSFFAITWCFLLKMEREYVDFRMQKSELLAKFDWQFFEIIGQKSKVAELKLKAVEGSMEQL